MPPLRPRLRTHVPGVSAGSPQSPRSQLSTSASYSQCERKLSPLNESSVSSVARPVCNQTPCSGPGHTHVPQCATPCSVNPGLPAHHCSCHVQGKPHCSPLATANCVLILSIQVHTLLWRNSPSLPVRCGRTQASLAESCLVRELMDSPPPPCCHVDDRAVRLGRYHRHPRHHDFDRQEGQSTCDLFHLLVSAVVLHCLGVAGTLGLCSAALACAHHAHWPGMPFSIYTLCSRFVSTSLSRTSPSKGGIWF